MDIFTNILLLIYQNNELTANISNFLIMSTIASLPSWFNDVGNLISCTSTAMILEFIIFLNVNFKMIVWQHKTDWTIFKMLRTKYKHNPLPLIILRKYLCRKLNRAISHINIWRRIKKVSWKDLAYTLLQLLQITCR